MSRRSRDVVFALYHSEWTLPFLRAGRVTLWDGDEVPGQPAFPDPRERIVVEP
jgi:hypothetical protein